MKTLLLCILLALTTQGQQPVDNAFNGRCPVCVSEGKRSEVYEGMSSGTLLATHSYYDADGKHHYVDPNIVTTRYSCSRGHRFTVSSSTMSTDVVAIEGSTKPQQPDTVAVSIPRSLAIEYLNGKCFPQELIPSDGRMLVGVTDPASKDVLIILRRGSEADPQAIAHALAIALHAHQEHTHSEKGVIPEGFIDIGDTFNDELNREMELIVPKIKPVTFCK